MDEYEKARWHLRGKMAQHWRTRWKTACSALSHVILGENCVQ